MQRFCLLALLQIVLVFAIFFAGARGEDVDIFKVERSKMLGEAYDPTWESLDRRPLPQWYDRAKVGIFIHWGVYSVPSFGSEWFWTNWRTSKYVNYVNFMSDNYKPGFTYQEFAHDFTAEHFNASEWAQLFQDSGAKYVVLTSKHHDGYALWPSQYSFSWNSVDVGPHRDIIGELAQAIRANTSMHFGLYHSLFEWFNPMYVSDRASNFTQNTFVTSKIIPEMRELIERYRPEVLWSDGEWEAPYQYWNATEFIAWLYNESPVRDTIVTNDRWGQDMLCKHGDFHTCADRYNPGVLKVHKWENAMTIDKYSWGHRANAKLQDYLTSKDLIREIATTVSCNGNILINVGPSKYGTIEPIFEERLRDMGGWLRTNGEAIYHSVPWIHQNDTQTPNVWYTSGRSEKEGRVNVYAIVLDYPFDAAGVNLFALGKYHDAGSEVDLLGYPEKLKWYGSKESVYVTFPPKTQIDKKGLTLAWTLRIDVPKSHLMIKA